MIIDISLGVTHCFTIVEVGDDMDMKIINKKKDRVIRKWVIAIIIVLVLISVLLPMLLFGGFLTSKHMDYEKTVDYYNKYTKELNTISTWLLGFSNDAYVEISFGEYNVYALDDYERHQVVTVEDSKVKEAISVLIRSGCGDIYKDENSVAFRLWVWSIDGKLSGGIAFSETGELDVTYTDKKQINDGKWYYYVDVYDPPRNKLVKKLVSHQ